MEELTLEKIADMAAEFPDSPMVVDKTFTFYCILLNPDTLSKFFPGYTKDADGKKFYLGIPIIATEYLKPDEWFVYPPRINL